MGKITVKHIIVPSTLKADKGYSVEIIREDGSTEELFSSDKNFNRLYVKVSFNRKTTQFKSMVEDNVDTIEYAINKYGSILNSEKNLIIDLVEKGFNAQGDKFNLKGLYSKVREYNRPTYTDILLDRISDLEKILFRIDSPYKDLKIYAKDLNECERLGIEVLPPTINKSKFYFSIEGDSAIRFGLGGIKNIGSDIVRSIVDERKENGIYKNLDDFVNRMYRRGIQKRVIEYLIMSGAMDEFGERNSLLTVLPSIFEKEKRSSSSRSIGQIDIFSLGENSLDMGSDIKATELPSIEKTPKYQILQWEKDLLGIYFSSHPLDNLQTFFESKRVKPIKDALEMKNNQLVILGVMVNKVRKITTKKGEVMAFLSIEDKSGTNDVIVFPRVYQEIKEQLQDGKPILIAARISVKNDEKSLIMEKGQYIDETKYGDDFEGITFRIREKHTEDEIKELKEYISSSKGETPVRIIVNTGSESKSVLLEKRIEMNSETKSWLRRF